MKWPICLLFLLYGTAGSVQAGIQDLLSIPSEISEKAQKSVLMDVVNSNGRLVTVGERGHILYSDNKGRSWKQAKVPVSVTLTAVTFVSPQKGWAVGHDGVVLHTRDGGRTWKKQLDGTRINTLMSEQLKEMIETRSKAQVISAELEEWGFFLSDLEMAVEEGPTRPLMDLWFKNEREGIVLGAFGMILRTTDGGSNWIPLLDRIANPQGLHYYGITRCGDALFIAGEKGILFCSDDWGEHWRSLNSPYQGSFFGIVADPDGDFVIAYGLRGNVFYSHDRGESWLASGYESSASVSGGAVLADGSVVLAGVDGTMMRSRDEGRSFSKLPMRFPGAIALAGTDGHLAAVGLRGFSLVEKNGSKNSDIQERD